MGFIAATTAGLVIWVVLWAIGMKALDAFFLVFAIVLVATVVRTLMPYMPGRRQG